MPPLSISAWHLLLYPTFRKYEAELPKRLKFFLSLPAVSTRVYHILFFILEVEFPLVLVLFGKLPYRRRSSLTAYTDLSDRSHQLDGFRASSGGSPLVIAGYICMVKLKKVSVSWVEISDAERKKEKLVESFPEVVQCTSIVYFNFLLTYSCSLHPKIK